MRESFVLDLRHALRHLRRSPGFASAALLTLALGIGANSAMFSLVNALLLRPLPIKDPHGLIAISGRDTEDQLRLTPIPAVDVLSRDGSPLQDVCGYNAGVLLPIEANGAPARSVGGLVTGRCFDAFGVPPLLGRTITDEDAPLYGKGSLVTVISHRLWMRMFNADPSAIGQVMRVEGVELRIIGVMPEGFIGLHAHSGIEFFTPFDTWSPARPDRRPAASHIVGRLQRGVTFDQASQQLAAQWPALLEFAAPATMPPSERQAMLRARPRIEHFGKGFSLTRDFYARPVTLMFGLTVLLLALACVNLGGLLLSRAIERAPETAMKLALGGSRWRIARQVLIENVVLSAVGAALAVPIAFAVVTVVISFLPQGAVGTSPTFTPDAVVIAVTALVGLAAGVGTSLLPMWVAAPKRVFVGMSANRTVSPAIGYWTRGFLVAQVALSLVMVIGAGLLGRSLYLLRQVDTGVDASNVMVARLSPLPNAYPTLNDAAYYPPLVERVAALSGVVSVAYGRVFPRMTLQFAGDVIAFVGEPDGDARAHLEVVSPAFFETLGVPLVAGRATAWSDRAGSPQVVVVTEQLARLLAPDGNVVGRRVRFGAEPRNQNVEIVGVVRNLTMGNSRRTNLPMFFRPAMQLPQFGRYPSLVIRHQPQALAGVTAGVRDIVAEGGREFLLDAEPLQDLLDRAPASERMSAAVAVTLASLAIVLALVGVYGVLAYSVSRRTREIGVRAAMGAEPASVMWMVMREGLTLTGIGVLLGLPGAYLGGRLLSSLTFGITTADPLTFGLAALFFAVLGAAGGMVPARRAAGVDPVIALRAE
jgi:predicted permease